MSKETGGAMKDATLRDMFAGQALNDSHANGWGKPEDQAKRAYAIADAMIAERSKT
jgi:hypothetical protein